MGRKVWQNGQWVELGGALFTNVTPITQTDYDNLSPPDPATMYIITDATGAASAAQSFRVNQRLATKIMAGENELWTPTLFATGGTITDIDVSGVLWRVHTFTSSGQFEVLQDNLDVEYLVVAGGGGGGIPSGYSGGGGGAGGLLSGSTTFSTSIFNITIGNGGAAGSQGEDSAIVEQSLVAIGGGAGGSGTSGTGGNGGSGGGGTYNLGTAGSATSGQGNAGGPGAGSAGISGGGGGATTAGSNSGSGGAGTESLISGTSAYYAGGGGGGRYSGSSGGPGAGGIGGGGAGGKGSAAVAGTPNTGGGGGGGGSAAAGGSGIAIVRYQIG